MTSRLRVAVTGLAATYPFGGVFWDYLQYPLGLQRMNHEVLYIEDTGKWCYEPEAGTFVEDGSRNAAYLSSAIERLDPSLAGRWFYRDATGRVFGRSWPEVVEFCRTADLFIHISASCWMRDEYFAARRVAFIDSDPMYTQASIPDYLAGTIDEAARSRVDMLRQHDVFFTFGENIGAADCSIPEGLFDWIPTRQPVVIDSFDRLPVPVESRRRVLTTVASWEPSEHGPVVNGVEYKGKSVEFERYLKLPERSAVPLELAMSGRAPADRLRDHGWQMVDAYSVSHDPWVYAGYLANSMGEWSVAKNAYVASRSGWFSCRTACYLALGVPAVVQDTGFRRAIPAGQGILSFNNLEEAASGIEEVNRRPHVHAKAAREIAREYFDSSRVLGELIERALN
jgi:hypothetical protein